MRRHRALDRGTARVSIGLALGILTAAVTAATPAFAVPIFGGPTYDASTGNGYNNDAFSAYYSETRPWAGNGVGIGTPIKIEDGDFVGIRAVRWDTSGAAPVELGVLGTSGGQSLVNSHAFAVNALGTAVGTSDTNANGKRGSRAVRWNAGTTAATELGNLGTDGTGWTQSNALAVNLSGTAVGDASKYVNGVGKGTYAVRWEGSGTAATELGVLGVDANGYTSASATAVNASGTAVGHAQGYVNGIERGVRPVRWDAGSTAAVELGNLGTFFNGHVRGDAYAINDAGTAVGFVERYNGTTITGRSAVRWNAGGTAAIELGELGVDKQGNHDTTAYAINAKGTTVGTAGKFSSTGAPLGPRAARWDATTSAITELDHLNTDQYGYTASSAISINKGGAAVGYARLYSDGDPLHSTYRATGWAGHSSAIVDLNTLLSPADAEKWTLTGAAAISDTYYVTGNARFDPDGPGPLAAYGRLFILDAISAFGILGDANRDDIVNFNDLLAVAQHYNQMTGGTWDTGDFTGDGKIEFSDLLILAKNYGRGMSATDPEFVADWAMAQSLVPEPTTVAALLAVPTLLGRRRR